MQLTLRTLLAYLDDVLEPAEAKEIGKKVQESPVATALVGRIREVMRRRRLGAPDLEGKEIGIDPNLVAQYIDLTLPPEQVAAVEKICLESDQQLAEVAACHQIMSIGQAELVEITPSRRERLYVLGPVEAGDRLQTAGDGVARSNGATAGKTPVSVKTIAGSTGQSFEESLPEYLKPKPFPGGFLTIAAGFLLIAVWLGVLSTDKSLRDGFSGLRAPSAPNPAEVVPEDERPLEPLVDESDPAAAPAVAVSKPAPQPEPVGLPEPPLPPAEKPAVAATEPDPPAPEPAAAPELASAISVQFISEESVLLQQDSTDMGWYVVPKNAEVKPGAILACPEPFESMLEFDQGALQVLLLGDTIVELIPPDEQTPIGIRLRRGRILLQCVRREPRIWPLRLEIGERAGVLQFGELDTLCGLEFLPQEPAGFEQPVRPINWAEGLYVAAGSVKWMQGEQTLVVKKGEQRRLLSDRPPLSSDKSPAWYDREEIKSVSVLRGQPKLFREEFELNERTEDVMRNLVLGDGRPTIAEWAVRCLALCDNYELVVQSLHDSRLEVVRKSAANGLKLWLVMEADRGPLLQKALSDFYERKDQVETLYRLLWGISVADARDLQKSEELVGWLESDKVAIKELALANLVRLTGRKFGYLPLAGEPQNRPAVKRWSEFVQRQGALIKADPPPGADDSQDKPE